MFNRILVPLDGSRLAESVLPLVEGLVRSSGGTVVLLHVLERGAPATVHGEPHLHDVPQAQQYLEQAAAQLRGQGVEVTAHAHDAPEGDVARSIAQHQEEEDADLIALCTHGRAGLRDLLYGSIAQQVLRRGTAPVLLVRPRRNGVTPPFPPEIVLVPLDGTAAGEVAVGPAGRLANALGAALHLVMVVPTTGTVRGGRQAVTTLMPSTTRAVLDLEQRESQAYLDILAQRLTAGGVRVTTEVRRGGVTSALEDEAAEPGIGLVVVATHGRAGVQAIWAGSVAAHLLSRTPAPVLLLRAIEH